MFGNRKTLACWLTISIGWTLSPYGGPTLYPAQEPDSCSTINYVGIDCGTFRFVGVEREKPFVARRVVTSFGHNSDGTSKSVEWTESVARDSQGRVRFEQKSAFKPPDWRVAAGMSDHEIEKIMASPGKSSLLVVIFDCFTGRSIVLQPELQVAHVMHTCDSLPPTQQGVQPYSYLITRLLNVKPQPNVSVEDLGLKEVAGITAHGLRSTSFGADKDGEWAGRPTGALERWMSDDLAATVLYIHSDFKAQVRTESRLANIKKGEPDASLFEIPLGYKVMLTQGTPELGIKERPL